MGKAAAAALLLAACIGSAAALGPSWYSCDPSSCKGDCECPSDSAPGGLSPKEMPQFVLITHDDAVHTTSNYLMRLITDGHYNPNGCNVPATYFVSNDQNLANCTLIRALFDDNNEIATHTINHKKLLPPGNKDAFPGNITEEVVGMRQWLVDRCNLPKEEIVGFRSPFLIHNPIVRKAIQAAGYLYDSSLSEPAASWSTSTSLANRLWPYTMDRGIAQDCNYTGVDVGYCLPSERYPGIWEVPMWNLYADGDVDAAAFSMDYLNDANGTAVTADGLYAFLQKNFDAAYNGNRAPLPLYLHSTYLNDQKVGAITSFIKYALGKGDVYFVTMRQLIDWMKNPVPASQISSALKCKRVELDPPKIEFCRTYTVPDSQAGQFYAIANQFDVADPKEILAVNNMNSAKEITGGKKIKIPPWNDGCKLWQKSGLPEPKVTPDEAAFTPTAWYRTASVPTAQTPAPAPEAQSVATPTAAAAAPVPAEASTTPQTTTTAAPAAAAPPSDSGSGGSVSSALIGGIVGGVVGAIALAAVGVVLYKKHAAAKAAAASGFASAAGATATAHISTTGSAAKTATMV
eukprot:scaffold8.g1512.t1